MLDFFRRYQRAFFIGITIVVVFTFCFFGTWGAFEGGRGSGEDTVAFVAVDGSKVYRSELNDYMRFLDTDGFDEVYGNGAFSGNPLNNGVVVEEFLRTGLAAVVAKPFLPTMTDELQQRLAREKTYTPYTHPSAPFIGAEFAWMYFAPDIRNNLAALKGMTDASTPEAFQTRIDLYLAQRKLPQMYIKQLVRYQESQHKNITPDTDLLHKDLSLFGYHTIEDWFGRKFLELVAEYLINASKIAEQKGMTVSRDEASAALYTACQRAYNEDKLASQIAKTPQDYFLAHLRHLGFDQRRATQIEESVLLFEHLMEQTKGALLVAPMPYRAYYGHENEYVDADLFELPPELRFHSNRDLEKLDLYVEATSKPMVGAKGWSLTGRIPLPANEVQKLYPELVTRQFHVRYATVDTSQLEGKIGAKTTWDWEVEDPHWAQLQEHFPELSSKTGKLSPTQRRDILDNLDSKTRALVDNYARHLMVADHPEWLAEALKNAPVHDETLSLREQGGTVLLEGIPRAYELIQFLDKTPLNTEVVQYTQDFQHYHTLTVLDKSPAATVISLKEALTDSSLNTILDRVLEATYKKMRTKKPSPYLQDNGEWKPLNDVRDTMAKEYFGPFFRNLDAAIPALRKQAPAFCDWDDADKAHIAAVFLPWLQGAYTALKANPNDQHYLEAAPSRPFYLKKEHKRLVRKEQVAAYEGAFAMAPGNWSSMTWQPVDALFYTVRDKGILPYHDELRGKVVATKALLGDAMLCEFGGELLQTMQKAHALSL